MKNIFLILIMSMVVIGSLFTLRVYAQAVDNTYTVLAPLPGTTDCGDGTNSQAIGLDANGQIVQGCKTDLKTYLPGLFKLLIGLSAAFAVLMIVIGGFQYMSTDAIQGKSNGKERIKNAIFGLVLVMGAWLILATINPNLLSLNLNIEPVTTTAQGVTLGGTLSAGTGGILPGYKLSQAQVDTNTTMVDDLKGYGISVNNNGQPCTTGGTSGCTNLVGLPNAAYSGVKELASECGCGITITGGTEGGHASHGPGLPAIDINSNSVALNNIIVTGAMKPPEQTPLGPVYTVQMPDGRIATFLKESNPPHWHAVFGGN